jgi:hypothetical protein
MRFEGSYRSAKQQLNLTFRLGPSFNLTGINPAADDSQPPMPALDSSLGMTGKRGLSASPSITTVHKPALSADRSTRLIARRSMRAKKENLAAAGPQRLIDFRNI